MTLHRVKMCSCTHEELHHPNGGPCVYGHNTVTRGCTCPGFSRRRRSAIASVPVAEPRTGKGDFARALDEVIRALTRLRDALPGGGDTSPVVLNGTNGASSLIHESTKSASRSSFDLDTRILTALASRTDRVTNTRQLAAICHYSHTTGTFINAVSSLKKRGMIDGDKHDLRITAQGSKRVPGAKPMPTDRLKLVELWVGLLDNPESRILTVASEVFPDVLTKEALAKRINYSHTTGSYINALSRLRKMRLLDDRTKTGLGPEFRGLS